MDATKFLQLLRTLPLNAGFAVTSESELGDLLNATVVPPSTFLDLSYTDPIGHSEDYIILRDYIDEYNSALLFINHPDRQVDILLTGCLGAEFLVQGIQDELQLPYTYHPWNLQQGPLLEYLLAHLKILSPREPIATLLNLLQVEDAARYNQLLEMAIPSTIDDVSYKYYRELLRLRPYRPDLIAESMAWLSTDADERRRLRSQFRTGELSRLAQLRTQAELLHWILAFPLTSPLCYGNYSYYDLTELLHESGLPFAQDIGLLDLTVDDEELLHEEKARTDIRAILAIPPVGLRVVDVSIEYTDHGHGHANLLVIDDVLRTVELFDPQGDSQSRSIDELLRELTRHYGYSYLGPQALCLNQRLQRMAGKPIECPKDAGFCLVLTSLYLHCRLLEPELPPQQLVLALLEHPRLPQLVLKYLTWLSIMLT